MPQMVAPLSLETTGACRPRSLQGSPRQKVEDGDRETGIGRQVSLVFVTSHQRPAYPHGVPARASAILTPGRVLDHPKSHGVAVSAKPISHGVHERDGRARLPVTRDPQGSTLKQILSQGEGPAGNVVLNDFGPH